MGATRSRSIRIVKVEAFDGIGEVAHEVGATKLAIGEYLETNFFLSLEDAEDLAVFDGLQLRGRLLDAACFEQFGGPKKAADVIGATRRGRLLLLSARRFPPPLRSNQCVLKRTGTSLKSRQALADERIATDAGNMRTYVDRCDDPITARGDGYGDRSQAGFELFVDNGVAIFADLKNCSFDLGDPGERLRRERLRFESAKVCVELLIWQ